MTAGELHLADGRMVLLRPAGQDDVPGIAELYGALSAESFRLRFQTGQPSAALLTEFARFDPARGTVCVVACPPGEPGAVAAEARYVPIGPGVAELALTVRDSYQGAGMGGLLLADLIERARAAGLERLRAIVVLANIPMLRLLQRYGWVLAAPTEDFSVACLEISAAGGMPGWPAGSAGKRVLVERRGWFDDQRVERLRSAGYEVRQCTGPLQRSGRTCPLVTDGRCRLAEEADLIVSVLPDGEADCAAVLAAHRRRWPQRLAPLSRSPAGSPENPS